MKQLLMVLGLVGISSTAFVGCNSGSVGNSNGGVNLDGESALSSNKIQLTYQGSYHFSRENGYITDITISPDNKLYAISRNYLQNIDKNTEISLYEYHINVDGSIEQYRKQNIGLAKHNLTKVPITMAWSGNNLYMTIGDFDHTYPQYNISYWSKAEDGAKQPLNYKWFVKDNDQYKTGIVVNQKNNHVYYSDKYGYNWYNISDNGTLVWEGRVNANSDEPTGIAITSDGQHLYTTTDNYDKSNNGYINWYDINATNGSLTYKGGIKSDDSEVPMGVAVSPDGQYAYVVMNNNKKIFHSGSAGYLNWYHIKDDGSLKYLGHIGDGDAQLRVIVSPNGKYVYTVTDGGDIKWYKVEYVS